MSIPVESRAHTHDFERRTSILEESIELFATRGFEAVSMRDIAKAVGITPAALYHHFTNKKHLHACAIAHAFKGKTQPALEMLAPEQGPPLLRLEKFVHRLCERFQDRRFRMLLQRERLDYSQEENNHAVMAGVFGEAVVGLRELLGEISPHFNKYLLANSVFGLVIHFYETESRRRHLPGYKAEDNNPDVITSHIMKLLLEGILPKDREAR